MDLFITYEYRLKFCDLSGTCKYNKDPELLHFLHHQYSRSKIISTIYRTHETGSYELTKHSELR